MYMYIMFWSGDRKIMQAGKMTIRPFVRMRNKNQFS